MLSFKEFIGESSVFSKSDSIRLGNLIIDTLGYPYSDDFEVDISSTDEMGISIISKVKYNQSDVFREFELIRKTNKVLRKATQTSIDVDSNNGKGTRVFFGFHPSYWKRK